MYSQFFNLKENPFSESPDTRYFFQATHQCSALARLASMLDRGQGFAVLTGEVGLGKTFLARTLMGISEKSAESALILFSALEGKELLETVLEEFGINFPEDCGNKQLLSLLTDFLIQTAEDGKTAVLIVDEAQNLTFDGIEVIRMLSNIEMDSRKLLQIILVGQAELSLRLKDPKVRQLNQRIGIRMQLAPFLSSETGRYLNHRIEVAGGSNFIRWSQDGVQFIHQLSSGIPRLINMQAQIVLEWAERNQQRIINRELVRRALNSAGVLQTERDMWFRKQDRLVQR